MAKQLVSDELWALVEPLLPPHRCQPGTRGSGMTCWRRLRDWHKARVWQTLHELMLAKLEAAHLLDWSRASVDSIFIRAKDAKKGGLSVRRSARRLWTEGMWEASAIR